MTTEVTNLERLRAYANSAAGMYGKMLCDPSTIIALITRCRKAESERDKWIQHRDDAVDASYKMQARAEKAESALAQAIAERDRMAEALRLFAALWAEPAYDGVLYIEAEDRPPDERSWGSDHEYDAHAITYGDLRRASQALTTTTEA